METQRLLTVFDMDGVLVPHRSSWRLVHEALGTNNEDSFLAYMRGEIDDLEFMERDIALWKGKVDRLDLPLIKGILDKVEPTMGFRECAAGMKGLGSSTVIISGGLDILADRLKILGGFDEAHSNGVEVDGTGMLTGKGVLRVPLNDKGSVLEQVRSKRHVDTYSIIVGDSVVDISMFRRADLSIAFRPESRIVSRSADIVIEEPDLGRIPGIISEELGI
ncbi:MAG: HAD-IB family phosphatase [Thermoplasmatota archaeon]